MKLIVLRDHSWPRKVKSDIAQFVPSGPDELNRRVEVNIHECVILLDINSYNCWIVLPVMANISPVPCPVNAIPAWLYFAILIASISRN